MNLKIRSSVLILILGLAMCRSVGNYKTDKIVSPTKKYYLIATVNRTDHGQKNFASVLVHLYNSDGHVLSEVDTRAGDASKWAVGWDKSRDTVILFSSDITNQAYKIEDGELRPIELTEEINRRAEDLKKEKYDE